MTAMLHPCITYATSMQRSTFFRKLQNQRSMNKRRLAKRDLAHILGFVSGSGKTYYYLEMKKAILTSDFKLATGIDEEVYKRTYVFTPEQSLKIISFFEIKEDELELV